MNKCKICSADMLSEGYIGDDIQLCHACYEKKYAICGDHLVTIRECGCKI